MKKKNKFSKILAMVLVLSLMLSTFTSISVFAQEVSSKEKLTEKGELWQPESNSNALNFEGDLSIEELQSAKLSDEDTPEIVSQESIEENGHVNRLWEQEEDLNTIIFQNQDGTKTAYHYSDPVKYADKNGKVKDKKNKLSETTTGEYTNAENDINAYFPKKIHKNKGVELKFGEYVFEMSPNINGSSGASRQTGHDKDKNPAEYVEYPEVFADDISLRYTPTFGGYKEDIILNTNVGINRFEFKLTTNGLSLVQASTGNYYLAEPLTGEYVTALGNVIVYDNTGVESEGYNHYYEVTTISQDEQYLITVIVDEHYLESKDTAYPVYVDPTLTVMPQGDVEDAALYSSNSETAYSGEIKIGYVSSYGTGRGLYNFPVFNFENDFIYMYGNQIVSAELNLYATIYGSNYASYNDAKTLSLHEFYSDWSPSTVKWSNTNPDNYNTLAISSKSVTTGWTAFNILPVIEKFKSDADYTMAFKGLLLKADSEVYTTWKKFVSSSGTMSRRPYITITYNDSPTACSQVVSGATYYIKNYNSEYLDVYDAGTADNTRLLTYAFNGNANQQFKITNIYGGEYEIAPQHTAGKVLSVNSSGQVVIDEDCNKNWQRWYIFYRNGSYHIVNKQYNTAVMAPTYNTDYVSINNEYDYCCWELLNTDPFHPSNIEYSYYTRITGENHWGLGANTDHTLNVFKSRLYEDEYFIVHDNINDGYTREYIISNDLIFTLNELERKYQENYNIIPGFDDSTVEEKAAHKAKNFTDELVEEGLLVNESSEYYGAWAFNYTSVINATNRWNAIIDKATIAYGVYLTITSYYYSYLRSTSTTSTSLSSTQYKNKVSYLDDIDDAMQGMSFNNKRVISAEERNLSLQGQGYTNPYEAGTPVVKFSQNSTTQYVRVYTSGTTQPVGKWIMKYSDIQGLTPAQIQSKFALPNTPTHYCFVNVPSGTQMYAGIVGENYGYTAGQAVQFELGANIPTGSFGSGIPLP